MPPVDLLEQRGGVPDTLRWPQEQPSARIEPIVEAADGTGLQRDAEIDQHVAAGDQIELREWRILEHAVHREHAHLANFPHRTVESAVLDEPFGAAFRRHAGQRRLAIARHPCGRDRPLVDVGAEDLRLRRGCLPVHQLFEHDRQGIDLLPAGTAGDPDADRVGRALAGQDFRQHRFLHGMEGGGIAKELGDTHQQVAEQPVDLLRLALHQLDQASHRGDALGVHAAQDAARQRRSLVAAEIMPHAAAQQGADLGEQRGIQLPRVRWTGRRRRVAQRPLVLEQLGRHRRHGQQVVDEAAGHRAVRHAGHCLPVVLRLGEDEPAVLLDRAQAARPVAARARQHDADGVARLVLGEGREATVDRPAVRPRRRGPGNDQPTESDRHRRVRRNDEHRVRRQQHAVLGFHHLHVDMRREQADQQALVSGIEMLDQHECHAGVGRQMVQKFGERVQPARRGADRHGQKRQDARRLGRVVRGVVVPGSRAEVARHFADGPARSCRSFGHFAFRRTTNDQCRWTRA